MIEKILSLQIPLVKTKLSGKEILKHPLFGGSAIMITGSNLANLLAYVYHLLIGRLLGPSPYGELAAFIAILGMISVVFNFMSLVIVKFVSGAKESEKSSLFNYFYKKMVIPGMLFGMLLLVLSNPIAGFLKIDFKIALLLGPSVFVALLTLLYRAYLQGVLKFFKTILMTNLDIFSRIIFGLLFIIAGMSSLGATFGIFLALIASYLLGVYFLRNIRTGKKISKYSNG